MLVRIVKLTFNEESIDFFFQEFDKSKALITNFKGCRGMRMLQDMNQKNIVMTYSHWDDENALNNYRNSQVFLRLWNKINLILRINLKHGAMKFILMDFILKRINQNML